MVLQLCPVSNINKHWLVTMNNLALFIITWTTEIDRRILIIDLKYVKFDKNKFKKIVLFPNIQTNMELPWYFTLFAKLI